MAVARTRTRIKGTKIYLRSDYEPAYDGQSTGRRVRNWMPQSGSINRLSLGNLRTVRSRCRDLERKVPWIAAAIDSYASNLIGAGIRPNSQAHDDSLRKQLNLLFSDWTEEADADGIQDLHGLNAMAVRCLPTAGEMFFRFRYRRMSDGLTVPLQVQALEADHVPLDMHKTLSNGGKIIAGVEFDRIGRRVAYHMYREHPDDILTRALGGQTVRVPANEVIHFFPPLRPGQVRGIPGLAPVMLRTRDLLEYEDAELVRKKTAAMFTAFVTKPDPDEDMFTDDDGGQFDPEDEEDRGVGTTALEPGTIQLLDVGEEIQFSTPADVGGNYEAFMKMQLHAIAAAIGVTYDQMTGDVSEVNFSSIRAGLLEFQRRARQKQRLVVHQICRPIWHEWLRTAVLSGAVKLPGFVGARNDQSRVTWVFPGWRYVNPKDEVEAAKAAVRAGFMSRAEVIAELGKDIEQVDEQIAKDNASIDEKGFILDSDPRKTTEKGKPAIAATDVEGGEK